MFKDTGEGQTQFDLHEYDKLKAEDWRREAVAIQGYWDRLTYRTRQIFGKKEQDDLSDSGDVLFKTISNLYTNLRTKGLIK